MERDNGHNRVRNSQRADEGNMRDLMCVCPVCVHPAPPFQEVFVFAIPCCTMDISNVPNAIEMCWSQAPDSGFLLLPLYDACLPLHI